MRQNRHWPARLAQLGSDRGSLLWRAGRAAQLRAGHLPARIIGLSVALLADTHTPFRRSSLVSRLPAVWAVTATCMYLNLWATSHRMQNRVRHGPFWVCDAPDSLDDYLDCFSCRLVAGMFDDTRAPHDGVVNLYGVGPAVDCTDVAVAVFTWAYGLCSAPCCQSSPSRSQLAHCGRG